MFSALIHFNRNRFCFWIVFHDLIILSFSSLLTSHLEASLNFMRKMPSQKVATEVVKMNKKTKPYKKIRDGRFQISLFKFQKIIKEGDTISSEVIVDNFRACVQYSICEYSTGKWKRQQIWCSPEELLDLGNALSSINDWGHLGLLPVLSLPTS